VATAIVSGALANKPFNGGEAWVRLSWALGLRRLGFETYFVEELASTNCVDRSGAKAEFSSCANRLYFEDVVGDFGLAGRAALLGDRGRQASGLDLAELRDIAADADLLVNISGHLTIDEILDGPRTRVYVDLDPGFTQAWHADERVPFELAGHDHYVTVGLNVGTPGSPIPDCGIGWIPSLPPVVLEEWPSQLPAAAPLRFTTVATWRSPYGTLEIDGRTIGLKHHQFRRLIELPERVGGVAFELALDIHEGDSADREALADHGWGIVDPREVAATPQAFREYVLGSGAEFSVAQGVYAETASGWFSDRTAAYLACGRPAVVQDTGIDDRLPLGEGILKFSSLEQAASCVERVAADYAAHSAAAAALAADRLDSDRVLGRLLATIGVEP
jgi:hypothetical protein